MPQDQFVRYKFTKRADAARRRAREYLDEFPKALYETLVEHYEPLGQDDIMVVTMKRLREPRSPR